MQLGDLARGTITGYDGIIESKAYHMHSMTRVGLRSRKPTQRQEDRKTWYG